MVLSINIKKTFRNFSLDVAFQTNSLTTAILGASGCGKSMTLKCIAGIETPDEGIICLNNRILFDSEKKINLSPQKRKVGYLLQSYALFPHFTVKQNLGCVIKEKDIKKESRINELLNIFQLTEMGSFYPRQLSGGQQQRVALARMLASEPELLLFDEPFSALDTYLREQLQIDLLQIIKDYAKTSLIVTHDRQEAFRMSEDLIVFGDGKIAEKGVTKKVFENCQTTTAARLTGCKNIFSVIQKNSSCVYVPAWNVTFKIPKKINRKITHIGIRAHDFQVDFERKRENHFSATVEQVIENPFHLDVLLKRGSSEIWWKIAKNQRSLLNERKVIIYPETIMLLE